MHYREYAWSSKRKRARGGFIEHAAEREDIRTRVESFPARLLGRHIERSAEDRPFARQIHQGERFPVHPVGDRADDFG